MYREKLIIRSIRNKGDREVTLTCKKKKEREREERELNASKLTCHTQSVEHEIIQHAKWRDTKVSSRCSQRSHDPLATSLQIKQRVHEYKNTIDAIRNSMRDRGFFAD